MYPLSASPPNPGGEESPFPYHRGRIGWGTYSKISLQKNWENTLFKAFI